MTERHRNHLCLAGVLGEVSPQWNCQWCPWHATNGCALLCRRAVPAGADVFHMLRLLGPWSFAWSRWAWLDSGLVEPHGFLRPGSSVRSIVSKMETLLWKTQIWSKHLPDCTSCMMKLRPHVHDNEKSSMFPALPGLSPSSHTCNWSNTCNEGYLPDPTSDVHGGEITSVVYNQAHPQTNSFFHAIVFLFCVINIRYMD